MLRLAFTPSRRLSAWLLAGHAAAAACVYIVTMPLWLKGLLALLLLFNLTYTVTHQAWRRWPSSVVALQFERDGGVIIECRNGGVQEARVLGSSFVAPYLTIVLLKPIAHWRTRAVVILPDAVAPELFRQLRVWLKWGVGRGVAPEASAGWAGRV